MRDDNGYQLGLALTQLSRIADELKRIADALETIYPVPFKPDRTDDGQDKVQ